MQAHPAFKQMIVKGNNGISPYDSINIDELNRHFIDYINFGGYPEGVSFAILVMNACVVLLDRLGRPKKFGAPRKEAAK